MAFVYSSTLTSSVSKQWVGPPVHMSMRKRNLNACAVPNPMHMSVSSPAGKLRNLLKENRIHLMPCCYDGLSAKLIQRAGFDLTFMSGFSTAGARGLPDTGLLSYKEMQENLASITAVVDIPVIADADTGFGNAINVRRTVTGFVQAGAAGLLIEDQVNPKRCGHTKGKTVVDRDEALRRVQAACDARDLCDTGDGGPVIVARTDAGRADFEEALTRARLFHEIGADMTFVEAPQTKEQMRKYCGTVPGQKLANMLEMGDTPILPPSELFEIGYTIAAYPLTLLSASVKAQELALEKLRTGDPKEVQPLLKSFAELRDVVGFNEYYDLEDKYREAVVFHAHKQ